MKNKNITTKVIGGKFKGIKLDLPSLSTTRSTKSILKESLFNSIAQDVVGKNFVEVFGGSGSVMIEAISRGAKHGYAIELDSGAYKILVKNCQKTDEKKFTCKNEDTFLSLPNLVSNLHQDTIFYFDPPFFYRQNMEDIYNKCFDLVKKLDKTYIYLVVFEHVSSLKMPQNICELTCIKSKKFGKSSLSYFAKSN